MGTLSPDEIRSWRKNAGLSMAELGLLLGGYSRGYICHIEHGRAPISKRFAQRFRALVNNGVSSEMTAVYIPPGVPGGFHVLSTDIRVCACGCGKRFVPRSWNHRYFPGHRRLKQAP